VESPVVKRHGETEAHARLKRLALIWAQTNGYSICATEVTLPRCRYRADIAAYRPSGKASECSAIFECKQALPDLRKDSCISAVVRERLATVLNRRAVLEKHLRVHYPTLRVGDSLFPEFDSPRFEALEHRSYRHVIRELNALQTRLHAGTKFEKLLRYRCADAYFIVVPVELFRQDEVPDGWGILVEKDDGLSLLHRPVLQSTNDDCRRRFLERIAITATRQINRRLGIAWEDVTQTQRKEV